MSFKIYPIAGDASSRKFYRIFLNKKSKIIISANKDKYKNLISYVAINNFLRKNNILAPKLITHNYQQGIIIIEDFGNTTYNKILLKKKNKINTYKKIIDLLLKIQKIKPKTKIKNAGYSPHIIKKYSINYLIQESNLFFDWYLPLFFKKKKVLIIKKKSNKLLLKFYKKLNFSNSYFVHRDFHVQNLMKVKNKIGVIDSQDALIGHPAYDLVSLIDDVRIKTSNKLKKEIYNYYLTKTSKIHRKNSKEFFDDFRILSVQRSLKIIGIFSRLLIRDKKNKYIKLIPYTWKLLEMRMNSEIFYELRKIFKMYIPQNVKKKLFISK